MGYQWVSIGAKITLVIPFLPFSSIVDDASSAAATELAEGRRAREKGAGLWEGAVYEGQQGEGVQLFAGPPMQWFGGGRE